jgi:hypothetical protein
MALTREQILARKVAGKTEEFKIDDDVVIIRGLTRDETLQMRNAGESGDLAATDNIMIHFGLVEPAMTVEEVAQWAAQDDAGTLVDLSQAIARLSRMGEGAGKSGVPRSRKRS